MSIQPQTAVVMAVLAFSRPFLAQTIGLAAVAAVALTTRPMAVVAAMVEPAAVALEPRCVAQARLLLQTEERQPSTLAAL
jgi:hypothetical protein